MPLTHLQPQYTINRGQRLKSFEVDYNVSIITNPNLTIKKNYMNENEQRFFSDKKHNTDYKDKKHTCE